MAVIEVSDEMPLWPIEYAVWPVPKRVEAGLVIRPLHFDDAETVRGWRNAQTRILRQSHPITQAQQKAYFAASVLPDFTSETPDKILVAIEQGSKMIGYGGLVHIDWAARKAEVSFLLEPSLAGTDADFADLFPRFLEILKKVAFHDLGLNRIWTETFDTREGYVSALTSAGFQTEEYLRQAARIDGQLVGSTFQGLLASD